MERASPERHSGCILLVDDDVHIRASFKAAVEDEGFEVVTAGNGVEALQKLRSGVHPHVIFLDLMMPVMDGAAFRAEQLKDPSLADIPTVVISAAGNLEQQTQCMGAVAYMKKPLSLDHMLELIVRYCEGELLH